MGGEGRGVDWRKAKEGSRRIKWRRRRKISRRDGGGGVRDEKTAIDFCFILVVHCFSFCQIQISLIFVAGHSFFKHIIGTTLLGLYIYLKNVPVPP